MSLYNLDKETDRDIYKEQSRYYLDERKIVDLEEHKLTRSNLQSRSRWQYLVMIEKIQMERGATIYVKEHGFEIFYTKEFLYNEFWLPLRAELYPNKKKGSGKQLNTKEFVVLAEAAGMMFAQKLNISIPFPNMRDLLLKLDAENKKYKQ